MALASASLEHELVSPPTDGVTCARFANTTDLLLVTSWDKSVRLYAAKQNAMRHQYLHKAAVLDACFSEDDSKGFTGGVDRTLMMMDFTTGKQAVLGQHEAPIKCVEFSGATGLVITGGWDCCVNVWDPRSQKALAGSFIAQEGCKVYTMSLGGNRLVVGTAGRHVLIYDVRKMGTPEQVRESSLMNQTRCIRCSPDGEGYALSSIEGRVAIEFFDPSPKVQKQKYAFKCHRKTAGKTQTLYPVNAIAYHPEHGTFATGGCDNLVNVWDGLNKKRICQYPAYPSSISYLDFNRDGTLLAVASSYTFEEGDIPHPPDSVHIRTVNEHEVKRKLKA